MITALRGARRAMERARAFLNRVGGGFGDIAYNLMSEASGTDAELLRQLKSLWETHHGPSPRMTVAALAARAATRATESADYFAGCSSSVNYVDVGGADGSVTAAVASVIGISPERATAVDVIAAAERKDVNVVQIDGKHLPFENSTIGLVTTFMSAHHFKDAAAIFEEIGRVCAPGARWIMREHGLADAETSIYYDFMHAFYAVVQSDETTPEEFAKEYSEGRFAKYRPPGEWARMATKVGFVCVDMTPPRRDSFDSFRALFVKTAPVESTLPAGRLLPVDSASLSEIAAAVVAWRATKRHPPRHQQRRL